MYNSDIIEPVVVGLSPMSHWITPQLPPKTVWLPVYKHGIQRAWFSTFFWLRFWHLESHYGDFICLRGSLSEFPGDKWKGYTCDPGINNDDWLCKIYFYLVYKMKDILTWRYDYLKNPIPPWDRLLNYPFRAQWHIIRT